jgi:hypothetical protein
VPVSKERPRVRAQVAYSLVTSCVGVCDLPRALGARTAVQASVGTLKVLAEPHISADANETFLKDFGRFNGIIILYLNANLQF